MKITKEEDYAVILMLALSRQGKKGFSPLSEIAKKYRLSLYFLKGIAQKLKRAGLIKSKEGKNGGYTLLKSPSFISYADIISAISGPIDISPCCFECQKKNCQPKLVWETINQKIVQSLSSIKLSQL